jgi:hypothetical protein
LIFWEYPIPTPYKVPNSPLHLAVTATGWELAVFHSGNQTTDATFVSIGSGTFATPLATDWNPAVAGSGTVHKVEALIDGSRVVIQLPNGSQVSVADARVASIPANVVCHEHYRAQATLGFVAFEEVWASTSAAVPVGAVDFSSTQFLANKTLSTSTLDSPRVKTAILDANGKNSAVISATTNAVNHLQFVNAPAGVNPVILPAGPEPNTSLDLRAKGTGKVSVTDNAGKPVIGFGRPSNVPTTANYWVFQSSGTGSDVAAAADGTDANVGINFIPKGTATFKVNGLTVGTRAASAPALSTSPGKPGQWAVDSNGMYVYTGDGTTHSWSGVVSGAYTDPGLFRPLSLWTGTKAQYDAIATKSPFTIYVVTTAAATLEGIVDGVTSGVDTGQISSEETALESAQGALDAVQTGDIAVDPPARTATTKSTRKK